MQEMNNQMLMQPNTQPPSQSNTEIESDDAFSYDGYEVVRGEFFAHMFEPSITFNNCRVSLNTACIRKVPEADYVQILVNPIEKKLAVRPCNEDEKDSFVWCSTNRKTGRKQPKQITCRMFFAKVVQLMDWNSQYRYKLLGKLIESNGEKLFVFDLNSPEIFQRIVLESGKQRASRTPVFPKEWQNQFGLPVEEHKKQLQIDIFDGYAVFGIKDEPKTANDEREAINNEEQNSSDFDRPKEGSNQGVQENSPFIR